MKKHYELGKRYHNGEFIGWAVWLTHEACMKGCCPKTVAEFYGKKAFNLAKKVITILRFERG